MAKSKRVKKVRRARGKGQGSRVKTKKVAKKREVKIKLKKMPKAELKIYKALLLKEREKVGGGLSHIAETTLNKSARDASGDLSGYSFHMADMASDDYEREFSLGRATDEQKMLYAIDEAMKRVEDGTYGNCLQCNKAIPKTRLKALPYTAVCIECQKANEGK